MAFDYGAVPLLGVTPSFFNSTFSPITSNYLRQVYQGAGQSFGGQPGQSLTGSLATSAINIGLNSALSNQVSGFSGLNLTSGSNLLATSITPFISSPLAAGINQNIGNTLRSAGSFGTTLMQGGGAATALNRGVTSVFGSTAGNAAGSLWGLLAFPGGGSEPASQYNAGVPYTLTTGGADVTFSIQPANQGPQLFGQGGALFDPKLATKNAFTQFPTNVPNYAGLGFNTGNFGKLADVGFPGFENVTSADFFKAKLTTVGATSNSLSSPLSTVNSAFPTNVNLSQSTLSDFSSYWNPKGANVLKNLPFNSKINLGSLGLGTSGTEGWTFITAPDQISWDTSNEVSRVDMFGTNSPPVTSGTRGMRDLTIANALVEGFIRNVNVEAKVIALENLLDYTLNTESGYVNVPVYQVWANNKVYGGNGYYIIKGVKIKEAMRDLRGNSTRDYVDIPFLEVPEYQVSSGRDQASQASSAAGKVLAVKIQADQAKARAGAAVPTQTPRGKKPRIR